MSKQKASQQPAYDYMFKTILIGSSGVGKSNILLRFTRNKFNQSHQTTIGVQYAAKNVEVNQKIVRLQIWDTVGQQQYKAIMKTFYKGASAILLTYDITSEKSYQDLEYWHKQIRQYSKSEVVVMLVGNKSDLQETREVSKQKGLEYAQKNKIAFYEVSAKEGTNVDLIFTKIAEQLEKIMEEGEKLKKAEEEKRAEEEKNKVIKGNKENERQSVKENIVLKNQSKKSVDEKVKKPCCK